METIKIEVKFNNKLIQTINLDADVLLKEFHKSHHTESEQTDVSKVKAISMTDWISIKSFITDNNIELTKQESGVLKYYIKHKDVSKKQARVLMILLNKVQNIGFIPAIPF